MSHKRTTFIVSLIILSVAGAAALYLYISRWPDLRYLAADLQTRQRLDTEKLQRGYTLEAQTLEKKVRDSLANNQDVAGKIDGYNSFVLNCRKRHVEILTDATKSLNSFLVEHSKKTIPEDTLMSGQFHPMAKFPDTMLIKEIRVDSASQAPKSIRTDDQDLLNRYHADVNVTVSVVMVGGKTTPTDNGFVANATPDKKWIFPSVTDVKQRILQGLGELTEGAQGRMDLEFSRLKREVESMVQKQELEFEKQELQEKYRRP